LFLADAIVNKVFEVKPGIHKIVINFPGLPLKSEPGQFVNVRVSETHYPLLRRPFSICDSEKDTISLLFNLMGEGTRMLAHLKEGDKINLLGPLGNGFRINNSVKKHIFVAGGMGVAPFPFLKRKLDGKISTFLGGRSSKEIIELGLPNTEIATDDGSLGFKGNVIELMESRLSPDDLNAAVIYGCGPTAMLRALKKFSIKNDAVCQVSTECAMACGFGICQGCPTESTEGGYKLVCKDGPVFDVREIVL